jgi:hypothetical protein
MALALELPIVSTDYLMDLAAMSPHSDPPIPSAYGAQLLLVVAIVAEPEGGGGSFFFLLFLFFLCVRWQWLDNSFEVASQVIARSGVPHAAKCGRHSLVHFVLEAKMEMPPTLCRVRYRSTFLHGNGNIATV